MVKWSDICEGIYDDDDEADESGETPGSFGWWVFPDGSVEEMAEMGGHGVTADAWLSNHDPHYANDDYDEAIALLIERGGVRVATFHGSDSMAINLPPTLTPAVRTALLRLISSTQSDFDEYYIGDQTPKAFNMRGAVRAIRQA
jgi:hypothetical protein